MAGNPLASSPELWKPVIGFEALYEVSSQGRVRSLPRPRTSGRVLAPKFDKKGYVRVSLGRGNTRQVHRLVLQAFVRSPKVKEEAAHLDGNPSNNCLENLAWKTSKENKEDQRRHGTLPLGAARPNAKLSDDDVRMIRQLRAAGVMWKDIERGFPNVHRGKLIDAGIGNSYRHVSDVAPIGRRLRIIERNRVSSPGRSQSSNEAGPA